MKRKRRYNY